MFKSEAMKRVKEIATKVAASDISVLITGEQGVGRTSLAKYIHEKSIRASKAFVALDIGARPQSIVDAEILGYERGAFTGAASRKSGIILSADKGTLLLKNIENIPHEKQIIILSFLTEKTITPIGASRVYKVDTRVIAIASSDIDELTLKGQFREDLYYRLAVVKVEIPPLRERPDDIIPLATDILAEFTQLHNTNAKTHFTKDARKALLEYSWPGNIVELRNVIESAFVRAKDPNIDSKLLSLSSRREIVANIDSPEFKQNMERVRKELDSIRKTTIKASPIWQGRNFLLENDLCFVLMPFGNQKDLQTVYDNHIKPQVTKAGLKCIRADDIHDISGVMQSVWEGINQARLIIADLTERNPNVFYELGIAHTLGKPVIMITQSMDFVPFDLRHLRCIVYDYKPNKIQNFEKGLFQTILTVMESEADGELAFP